MRLAGLSLVLFLAGVTSARAEVIAEQSSGLVPLEGETQVVVRGVTGEVVVWGREEAGVEFDLTNPDTKAELPVRVSSEGNILVFEPPAGAPEIKRHLFLSVPRDIAVRVEAENSRVEITRLQSRADVAGKNLVLDLAGSSAPVTLELQKGSVNAMDISGDLVIRGREWSAKLATIEGRVGLYGGPGTVEIQGLGGRLDAEIEQVNLRVVGADGDLQVRAKGGRVDLTEARSGGDLRLTAAPLMLVRCEGVFHVATDGSLRFNDLRSDLLVDGESANIEGTGNTRSVEVRNHDGSLLLSKIVGAVRVEGTSLTVTVKEAGEARIDTKGSTIDLAAIGGKVQIVNDGGDVRLTQIFGDTDVTSNGGNVRVLEQGGPIQLTADGEETLVGWSVLPPGSKSSIENVNGPVVIQLPSGGNGCRIEAQSSSGRIESPFKRVVLSGDRTGAQGFVGSDQSTVVRVKAAGDIRFSGGPHDADERP